VVDPGPFLLHCYYCFTFTRIIYILANYYLLPLDMLNPLFTANRWDWQPHRKLGQSTWLCCVQVPRCCWWKATHRQAFICCHCPECRKASGHHPSKVWFFLLLVRKTLVSQLRETCCCAHHTFLLGYPTRCLTRTIKHFFLAPLPGRNKISARGVSHAQSFTLLLFCFILFFLASFYQTHKKISSFDSLHFITFTFSSLCCSLSMLWRTLQ
jgi:hypothetical protein